MRAVRDGETELGESDEPATAKKTKLSNPLDRKPDPPLNITCWHELGTSQIEAVKQAAALKEESKTAGDKFIVRA